jgi:hypothetical protein
VQACQQSSAGKGREKRRFPEDLGEEGNPATGDLYLAHEAPDPAEHPSLRRNARQVDPIPFCRLSSGAVSELCRSVTRVEEVGSRIFLFFFGPFSDSVPRSAISYFLTATFLPEIAERPKEHR